MKKTNILLALLAISMVAQFGFGQGKKTSTPEEKATFVKGTRLLEQDPFNKKAKDISRGLLVWLIEAPDVSVSLCSDFLTPIGKKYKYSPETTSQFTFGMGAYIIEHPEKANDERAVYQGGLESMSKMYESMLKAKSDAKNDFLDRLVDQRNKSELEKVVDDILKNGGCKSK